MSENTSESSPPEASAQKSSGVGRVNMHPPNAPKLLPQRLRNTRGWTVRPQSALRLRVITQFGPRVNDRNWRPRHPGFLSGPGIGNRGNGLRALLVTSGRASNHSYNPASTTWRPSVNPSFWPPEQQVKGGDCYRA
jgi:hypothetical protein